MSISWEMIKGVIFDVDGTLLDSVEVWMTVSSRYIRSRGLVPEKGLDEYLFSLSMEDGAAYLAERYGLKKAPQRIIEEIDEILRDYYRNTVQPREGAEDLLKWLARREIRFAAATATDRPLVESAFRRLGLLPYFQEIFTCGQVGESKRSPLIYRKAAECLGTKPEETLVVEDALFALTTAKNAGFLTAGVGESHNASDQEAIRSLADVCGGSPAEILKQLQRLYEVRVRRPGETSVVLKSGTAGEESVICAEQR